MSTSASNVTSAKPKTGGAVSIGDTTLTMPTDASTALASGFTSLGYCDESGLIETTELEVNTTKAWGGDVVDVEQTSKTKKYKFKLMEVLNPDVQKVTAGDSNVTGALTTGITIKETNDDLGNHAYVFDMVLKNKVLQRIVVPCAHVSAIGDETYVDNATVVKDVEITAMADSAGTYVYKYILGASK